MKKLLYILLAMPLFFLSCNEDEIMTFDSDDAGIYFQTGVQTRFFLNIDQYWDSLSHTFSQDADTVRSYVMSARLRTLGKVRDYDRKVRVVVDQANTTAVEGTHFTVNFDNIVVPAGAAEVEVPVTFLRHPDLLTKELRVMIKVEDNENFKVPFTRQKNTNIYYASGDTLMADRFLFIVDEFYTEPVIWSFFNYSFPDGVNPCGAWSPKKQKLMSQLFGITEDDWDYQKGWANDRGVRMNSFIYYAIKLQAYLQEQADNGNPIREEDGSFMQLGPGHEVDYSAYM